MRESLPRGYYRELPELAGGPLAGYPAGLRARHHADLAHRGPDRPRERRPASSSAFQEVAPLTIGELWAVPAMLRLGLIENVRRMALRTVQRLDEIGGRRRWAAARSRRRRAGDGARSTRRSTDFVADPPPLTPTFVSRFLHQLRVEGGALPAAGPAGAVDRRGGAERGGGHRARHPAAGAHPGGDGQQHHQPARHRPDGLARRSSSGRAGWRRCCARTRPASTRG